MNVVKGIQNISSHQWGVWAFQGWINVPTVTIDRELLILLRFHDQQISYS